MLTSHVDILPTMLGLAGINVEAIQKILRCNHNEVHRLVGRDLSPLIVGKGEPERAGEPIFFMTDDDVTRGPNQVSAVGQPYNLVFQPNHIQTGESKQLWKYSCYYDNPQFWSNPGVGRIIYGINRGQGFQNQVLDKQVHVGLVGLAQVGGHAGEFQAVDQLFLADAHDVHGHGAGNHFYPLLPGGPD